jgi:hypothetical protein
MSTSVDGGAERARVAFKGTGEACTCSGWSRTSFIELMSAFTSAVFARLLVFFAYLKSRQLFTEGNTGDNKSNQQILKP